jgi:hypothetical protein
MSEYIEMTAPFIGRHETVKQTYPSLWGTWGPNHVASRPYATSAPMVRYPAMRGAAPYPLDSLGLGADEEDKSGEYVAKDDTSTFLALLPHARTAAADLNVGEAIRIFKQACRVLQETKDGATPQGRAVHTAAQSALAQLTHFMDVGGAYAAYAIDVPGFTTARDEYLKQLKAAQLGHPAAGVLPTVEGWKLDTKNALGTLATVGLVGGLAWLIWRK